MLRNTPDNHLKVDLDNWKEIADRLDAEILEKELMVYSTEGEDKQAFIEVLILRQQVKLELLSYLINYLIENRGIFQSSFYQDVLEYVNKNIAVSEAKALLEQGIVPYVDSAFTSIAKGAISITVNTYSAFASYIASYFPDQEKLKQAKKLDAAARREQMRDKYHLSSQPGIEVFDDGVDLGVKLYPVDAVGFRDLPRLLASATGNQKEKYAADLKDIETICKQLQNPARYYSAKAYEDLESVKDALNGETHGLTNEEVRATRRRVAKVHLRRIKNNQAIVKINEKLEMTFPGKEEEFVSFKNKWLSIRDYAGVTPSALPRILTHFEALGSYIRGYLASEVPQLDITVAEKLQLTSQLTEALLAVNYEVKAVLDTMQAWIELDTLRKEDEFSPIWPPKYHNLALHAYYRLHEIAGADTIKLNTSLKDTFDHEDREVDDSDIDSFVKHVKDRRQLEADYLDAKRPETPPILLHSLHGMDGVNLEESYHEYGHDSIVLSYHEDLTASLLPDPTVRILTEGSDLNAAIQHVLVKDYIGVEKFTILDAINLLESKKDKLHGSDDLFQGELMAIESLREELERESDAAQSDEDNLVRLGRLLAANRIAFVGNLSEIQAETITQIFARFQDELSEDVKALVKLYLDITNEFATDINDSKHRETIAPLFVNGEIQANVVQQVDAIKRLADSICLQSNASQDVDAMMKQTLRVTYNLVLTPGNKEVQQQLFDHAKSIRKTQHGKRFFGLLYGLAGVLLGAVSAVTFSFCKKAKQQVIDEEARFLLGDMMPPVSRGGFFAQKTYQMFKRSRDQFKSIRDDRQISDKLESLAPRNRD